MGMTRRDFIDLAITTRNEEHLFLDRRAFVQHAVTIANFCGGTNPRFRFDTFLGEVGLTDDEWKESGGFLSGSGVMSNLIVRPCPPVRRSHHKSA